MTTRIELPTDPPCLARREPVPMKTLAWTWIVVVVPVVSGQTGLNFALGVGDLELRPSR